MAGIADTVQVPGEPPMGVNGISAEFMRQQVLFDRQVVAALESLESQINAGRNTT